MWTVRLSYSLPGQNVLVSQFQGEENVLLLAVELFLSDPSPIVNVFIPIYVSEDSSRSDFFITWNSQQDFDAWYAVHGEVWDELLSESNAHGAEKGVVFERKYPPHEDYDWNTEAPSDMVQIDDIFAYLSKYN
jgi:hypothetical protein